MGRTHRWPSPYEWLEWRVDSGSFSENELKCLIKDLAQRIGPDEIQDMFQSDMEIDGYFNH